MNLEELCQKIDEYYRGLSAEFGAAQKATGLNCPPDCGKCCSVPTVEASEMEMLPMALELWKQGRAETILDEMAKRDVSTCVMFAGRCTMYQQRPSVCRMFGVGLRVRKDDELELSICRELRLIYSEKAEEIDKKLIPNMSEWSFQAMSIDPHFLRERRPISMALRDALEKVLFYKTLSQS
jgi:uncharacterized protein